MVLFLDISLFDPASWDYEVLLLVALTMVLLYRLFSKASRTGVNAWRAARQDRHEAIERLRKQNNKLRKKITEYHKDYVRILQDQNDSGD